MKVILKTDIENLGKFGEVVEVKRGYARNYLVPKDMVWPCEDRYLKMIEGLRKKREAEKAQLKTAAEEKAKKISDISLTIAMEVGEEDRIFGTVTTSDLSEKFGEAGLSIDKKDISIEDTINKLGVYQINVALHPQVTAQCRLWVVKK